MRRNLDDLKPAVLAAALLLLTACGRPAPSALQPETLMLDWVPNTNHTGLFVAQQKGYFADEGLDVKIVQPGEVYAEQAVASGAAAFGVSFQEQVTLARADDVPIVSIAAILQHNTSGFASRAGLGAKRPGDWEGLRYGSFGSPFEAPTLAGLMRCDGADPEKVTIIDTGFTDPLALLQTGQIDLAWIFYGWQGIQAAQQGVDLNIVMMDDHFDCIPDYYTPVLITSQKMIDEDPRAVGAFLRAAARGYTFAIDHPDEAADVLLQAAPELDRDMVVASQRWISPRYRADSARWGLESEQTWQRYADWMRSNGVLQAPLDTSSAFTNEFLP